MRKRILIFIMMCWATFSYSQESISFFDRLIVDGRLTAFAKQHEMSPLGLQIRWGYMVTGRLGAFASLEAINGFGNSEKGVGTYHASNSLGGGVMYRLVDSETGFLPGFRTLDVHASCGTTLGNLAWKYTMYDVGLSIGLKKHNTPTLGLGYRVMDSRNNHVKSFNGLYVFLGFRL